MNSYIDCGYFYYPAATHYCEAFDVKKSRKLDNNINNVNDFDLYKFNKKVSLVISICLQ